MRKNIILITFLFFTTLLCSAQKDSTSQKKVFGVRAGLGFSSIIDPFDYYANISIEKGKNFFAIGPVIGRPITTGYDAHISFSNKSISLNGVNFVFQRNPNPKGKRFDFYFQYILGYFHNSDKGQFLYPPPIYDKKSIFDSEKSIFVSTIGYGFKCKIFQKFYLFNDFGMGAAYTRLSINYNSTKSDINNQYFLPIMGMNFGLEYKLDKMIK